MIGILFYSTSGPGLFPYMFTAVTLILEHATFLIFSGSTQNSAFIKLGYNIFNLDCLVLLLNFLQLFKTIQMKSSYNLSQTTVSLRNTFDINMTFDN